MPYPIIIRHDKAGEATGAPLDLAEALTGEWSFDAHIVQYEGTVRRNKADVNASNPLVLTCEFYDFDNKELPEPERAAWAESCLAKLPPDFTGYRTSGGFRAVTLCEPFEVKDAETWEDWRQRHGGRAEALGAILGAAPDHSTDEPNRLFRLPGATRDDGKPSYTQLYGEIGFSTLAPAPYERRKASETYTDGDARHSKVGAAFVAAGLVQRKDGQKLVVTCPWVHEHSGKNASGTFVDDTEDHFGHFVCSHSHCVDAKRHSLEALAELSGRAAVREELSRWPEPRTPEELLRGFVRLEDAAPAAKAEVSIEVSGRFIGWQGLMEPMGEVPWLIKDLEMCPGRPPMLISDSGVGKTWTLQAMALAVATGQPVFGRFPCRKAPVLHLSLDSGLRATKVRYQRLARGMGISQADVVVFPHRLPLTDSKGVFLRKGLEEIAKEVERGKYGLVILDSLASLCAGIDENSTDIGEPLRATTDDECVWLWAHHTTKSGEGYRGSGAIKAAAGAVYVGTRDGEQRIWTPLKASEEHESGDLPTFQTQWHVDADGGARIVALEPEQENHDSSTSSSQKAAWEMLKVIERKGSASATELLTAAGAAPGVKGRARTRANEVLGSLAQIGLIVNVAGEKYILAAGVEVPRAAHQIQVSDEAARRK